MHKYFIEHLQQSYSKDPFRQIPCKHRSQTGRPTLTKIFTVVMEKVFKKEDISEGINVDGENLTNLRFADDVALSTKKKNKNKTTTTTKNQTNKTNVKKHLNNLNSESLKIR